MDHREAAAVKVTIVSIVSFLFVACASSKDQGIVASSSSPPPQYTGNIESAVGEGSDLWLVTCIRSCGQQAGRAGTIQMVSSVGSVVTPGYATPVGAVGVLAHDGGDLFALDFSADTVTRLRADTGDVVWTTDLQRVDTQTPGTVFLPEYVTVSGESVWISSAAGGIAQLDRATGQLLHVLTLPPESTGDVAWGAGSLWVSEALAGIWHLTPDGQVTAKVRLTGADGNVLQVGSVAATPEGVWVTGDWAKPFVDAQGTSGYEATETFAVGLVDPATNTVVFSADLPQGVAMTVIDDAMWLIGADGRIVYHADRSGITPIPLALETGQQVLALTSAGVWIADSDGVISLQPLPPSPRVQTRVSVEPCR